MFRVWDIKENKWITSSTIRFCNDDVAQIKKCRIGNKYKINLMSDERYIYNESINCCDCNGVMIYEGDILKAISDNISGVVVYSEEFASYILLDYSDSKYYPLGSEICKYIEVVGNVFEDIDLLGVEVNMNEGKESE